MATTSSKSRLKFYASARQQLAVLTKHPKVPRKLLVPALTDVLTGILLILAEQETADVKH